MERIVPDAGQTIRDCDAPQGAAGVEHIVPDAGQTIRDCDALQGVAGVEHIVPDAGHTLRDCDALQGVAGVERIVPDADLGRKTDFLNSGKISCIVSRPRKMRSRSAIVASNVHEPSRGIKRHLILARICIGMTVLRRT